MRFLKAISRLIISKRMKGACWVLLISLRNVVLICAIKRVSYVLVP